MCGHPNQSWSMLRCQTFRRPYSRIESCAIADLDIPAETPPHGVHFSAQACCNNVTHCVWDYLKGIAGRPTIEAIKPDGKLRVTYLG
jgi:hypothetical protein